MAPVSNPDKDLDAPDGGEACLMASLSTVFTSYSFNVAKKLANLLVSILEIGY